MARPGRARITINRKERIMEYISPDETYPFYEGAIAHVLERFEIESYGAMFLHEELKDWMGIKIGETIAEAHKENLDYFRGIVRVRDSLLEDYNICLASVVGNGYKILTPEEQIHKGPENYIRKSQKAISRAVSVLTNVDRNALSYETKDLQLAKIARMAFIKSAYRKRRIPAPVERTMVE